MNKKKFFAILKILSIILIIIVEILVFFNYWLGHILINFMSPIKLYLVLTGLIILITIMDKVIYALIELAKASFSKKYRLIKIKQINEELVEDIKPIKKVGKIFHLIIFNYLWLVFLVFTLHSTEWLINGWSLLHGKAENVVFYSVAMRLVEYPIVIITFLYDFIKNKDKYMSFFKNKK